MTPITRTRIIFAIRWLTICVWLVYVFWVFYGDGLSEFGSEIRGYVFAGLMCATVLVTKFTSSCRCPKCGLSYLFKDGSWKFHFKPKLPTRRCVNCGFDAWSSPSETDSR
jgi:Zn ribbon nucleic-acid-binding protein